VPDRITYAQAAAILGCHVSNVPKLVDRGLLTSTGQRGASLDREQVEQLAQHRAEVRAARDAPKRRASEPPDQEHEWLSGKEVAELLGVSREAVSQRVRRGRLPVVIIGRRHWIRRDLLEQVEAARLVRKTRSP
jgi:excisionase family DNA binding protein